MEGKDRTEKHGGRELRADQIAEIIYEATTHFCDHFLVRRSHTATQMVEVARSGQRIIAEGRRAGISPQSRTSLLAMARTCLEELLGVYEDFLHLRGLPLWVDGHPQAAALRKLVAGTDHGYERYRGYVEGGSAEAAANCLIGLISHTRLLLAF